jgi:hypothetical protein
LELFAQSNFFFANPMVSCILRFEGKRNTLMVRLILLFTLGIAPSLLKAQTEAAQAFNNEPAMTQIRKSVTFIALTCSEGTKKFTAEGTGFFIGHPVANVPIGGVVYLVTNKHVALCLDDSGHPMQVESVSIRVNRLVAQGGNFSEVLFLNEHGNVSWITPTDSSIDLAAFNLGKLAPNPRIFDYMVTTTDMLATRNELTISRITEGEPVFFAGFFRQFPGEKRMEPIVRNGIIAMMPDEKIPFVGGPESLYLADLHVFHGNSGSPVFINLGGYRNGGIALGQYFKIWGVVNGYLFEDEQLNLRLQREVITTVDRTRPRSLSLKGSGEANSGISTIVPADQVKALLEGLENVNN